MAKNKGRKQKRQIPQAAATAARPEKIPRVGENVGGFWQCRPIWSFALLDLVALKGGWIHLRQEHLDTLLPRFRDWEKMTWGQILSEGKKQNHPVDVANLIPEAQERLKHLKLDDHEQLTSLRVNARARVYGILDREVFLILWWDPDHQICPAPPKHT